MAITTHEFYDNFVLSNKFSDLLETKLNVRSLMKVDTSLQAQPGMKILINTYDYDGSVAELGRGEGNTTFGKVSLSPTEYEAKLYQQAFEYADEDVMRDPNVVEMGLKGGAEVMVNDLTSKFFAELQKATLTQSGVLSYDVVVDAIAALNTEDESGLVLLIGLDNKAVIRKDPEFKSARLGEILYNGQIGDICGIPVVVSKAVKAGEAFLLHKEAVTMYVKKESEIEQERDANHRKNSVFMRKVGIVALTDKTKVVKISEE